MTNTSQTLPKRSTEFGVGKEIGGAVYLHCSYEDRIGNVLVAAKAKLRNDFDYQIVKYNYLPGLSRLFSITNSTSPQNRPWATFSSSTQKAVCGDDGNRPTRKSTITSGFSSQMISKDSMSKRAGSGHLHGCGSTELIASESAEKTIGTSSFSPDCMTRKA